MAKIKKRLDARLLELYPEYTRSQLQGWIMRGEVFVNDLKVTKSGVLVTDEMHVELRAEAPRFVSRAGYKLEHALKHFDIDVRDKVMLDAGLSTGGFTDCLLQQGAAKVYGVDVGWGQVHEKLRTDKRLVIMERTNLRELTALGERVDGVTLDLSFISVIKVLDAVESVLKPGGFVVVLIKPQFEATRGEVGKGGIITDPVVHERVIKTVVDAFKERHFDYRGVVESPILGGDGNKEFLAYFDLF